MTIRVLLAAGLGFLVPLGAASAQTCDPVEAAKLLAPDGSQQEYFGSSVSIDGDTALVGVYGDGDNGPGAGAVHVFRRDGVDWLGESKLLPADGAAGDLFGAAVAISGDTAVVGAWGDGDNGSYAGSAYIFRYHGRDSTWVEEAKLLPSDGAANDLFGFAVSIFDDTVVIGASGNSDNGSGSGSAYVFGFDGDDWLEEVKLLPAEVGPGDAFGASVAISLDTAVIGAWGDDENGDDAGAVYVLRYEGQTWVDEPIIRPSDGAAGDYFGGAVALSGDTAIIGADGDDDNGADSGSARIYRWNGISFEPVGDKLVATNAEQQAYFGYSVAISGDTAVVGAWGADANGADSGSAYVFTDIRSGWEATEFHPATGGSGDWFGSSVAISGDTAIIGADGDDDNGTASGAAYAFDLGCGCPQDLNGDGVVNTQDFLAFLTAWANADPLADWNGDGAVNTIDFLAYLTDWAAGCP
jgi:hypothetical protein